MSELNMIERVAKALADCALEPFDSMSHDKYTADAKAVLAAMREPTATMIDAAVQEVGGPAHHWRAMISAALTPTDYEEKP